MVVETAAFAGLDGSTFSPASNSGIMFLRLAPHEDRRGDGQSAAELAGQITGAVAGAEEGAQVFFLSPPPVPGPRQWQRLRDDDAGPRKAPAIRRCRARPSR